jgi:hypothetical protein
MLKWRCEKFRIFLYLWRLDFIHEKRTNKNHGWTWYLIFCFIIENAAEVVADAVDPITNDVDDNVDYDPFVDDTTEFFLEGNYFIPPIIAVDFDIAIVLLSMQQ